MTPETKSVWLYKSTGIIYTVGLLFLMARIYFESHSDYVSQSSLMIMSSGMFIFFLISLYFIFLPSQKVGKLSVSVFVGSFLSILLLARAWYLTTLGANEGWGGLYLSLWIALALLVSLVLAIISLCKK
ncbi:MAG: hypothetical protein Q7R72_01465 [bacterium]|nr:hypothetical protein [bacterium]